MSNAAPPTKEATFRFVTRGTSRTYIELTGDAFRTKFKVRSGRPPSVRGGHAKLPRVRSPRRAALASRRSPGNLPNLGRGKFSSRAFATRRLPPTPNDKQGHTCSWTRKEKEVERRQGVAPLVVNFRVSCDDLRRKPAERLCLWATFRFVVDLKLSWRPPPWRETLGRRPAIDQFAEETSAKRFA